MLNKEKYLFFKEKRDNSDNKNVCIEYIFLFNTMSNMCSMKLKCLNAVHYVILYKKKRKIDFITVLKKYINWEYLF